ncbi:MAG: hypothetical protein AVDCRST_MAG72-865 [uncultured Nocardioidaceae bacterium]|uniref:Phosphatidic acid phosphatase type 2/haloperoxidase domain-containing protein n=1 Tax=uncultured Nocardioidaceae bacterium TaxID=253824 RepID=A0A6J4LU14_9ACTN|nr:MAG: hypothetical protein AVDCRST_MAG72-865 [uncultured Nocardioidaceae bacterium]
MRRRRREATGGDGWDTDVASGLALAGFLTLVFVAVTLLAMGPLAKFDAYFTLAPPPEPWRPVLHVVDRIGQRAVCLPILAVVALMLSWRHATWRPAVVAMIAVFGLNLTVLILKVVLGREGPYTVDPSFFNGGMAYPSGHSANIVLVYGLIVYLVSRYSRPSRRTVGLLWGAVGALAIAMLITSLTLDWHWFADLVAGFIVGGIVLEVTASVDRALPALELGGGWRAAAAELAHPLRLMRSGGSAQRLADTERVAEVPGSSAK